MREIKFRVWEDSIEEKAYYSGDSIFISGHGISLVDEFGEYLDENNTTKIEQYTGIKDMNGVEVYEGDIIKFHVVMLSPDDKVGYVKYYPAYGYSIMLQLGRLLRQEYWASGDKHTIEVVGNIHENEELLQ